MPIYWGFHQKLGASGGTWVFLTQKLEQYFVNFRHEKNLSLKRRDHQLYQSLECGPKAANDKKILLIGLKDHIINSKTAEPKLSYLKRNKFAHHVPFRKYWQPTLSSW